MWGPLSEKVFAKVMGNYERINSGYIGEAWDFLTGVPSTYYSMADTSTINNNGATLWDLVNDALANNLVAAFSTDSSNPYNLVPSHAYTIVGTYNYTDDAGVSRFLLRIRNPWGSDHYNSSLVWADNDTVSWTLNAKNMLPYSNDLEDGLFFAEADACIDGFNGLWLGHFYDNYFNNYLEVINDKGL